MITPIPPFERICSSSGQLDVAREPAGSLSERLDPLSTCDARGPQVGQRRATHSAVAGLSARSMHRRPRTVARKSARGQR